MNLPTKTKSEASATITPTLVLLLACWGLLALSAYAAAPSWWDAREATNSTYGTNDDAVATQGQLKQFTARAADELNADLPANGGAGSALSNLVTGWQQDYLTNGYATNTANPTRPYKPADFQAVTIGQLKDIASLLYGQLSSAGYTGLTPTWIQVNTNTDTTAAVVGQIKEVFNFNLTIAPPAVTGLTVSNTNPDELDLAWILPDNNNGTMILINQSLDGGVTWTTVATLAPTATSYAATGLGGDASAMYQVVLANSLGGASSPSQTPLPTPIISAVPRYALIDLGANFSPAGLNDNSVMVGYTNNQPAIWDMSTNPSPTLLSTNNATYGALLSAYSVVGIDNAGHVAGDIVGIDRSLTNFPTDLSQCGCYWTNAASPPSVLGQGVEGGGDHYAYNGVPAGEYITSISPQGYIVGNSGTPDWAVTFSPSSYYGTTNMGQVLPITGTTIEPPYGYSYEGDLYGSGGASGAAGTNQWCGSFGTLTNYPVINGTIYAGSTYSNITLRSINSSNYVVGSQLAGGINFATMAVPGSGGSLAITNLGCGYPRYINDYTSTNMVTTITGGVTNVVTNIVYAPQVIGEDLYYNPVLWDQTTYQGTNTLNGTYVQKNPSLLIPNLEGTNSPPWQMTSLTGLNNFGTMVGNATYSGTNTAIPKGPHGVMLLPVTITPSIIPTTGVARAKLVFGSGVQVPAVNPSTTQFAMTIGGQNCTNILQDQNNPNIFYFTVPPGTAGSADVTISGIQIPGMPWLSATPTQTMTLPKLVQYTSDPDTGVQGFSTSNVVSIDEAKSDIDYEVQQGMITSAQATTEFAGSRDSNADLQGPLFEQFLAIQSPDASALTAMAQQADQEMNIFYAAYPLSTPANASTGVAIFASLSDAYETGPASGMLTVTIPSALTSALTVNYTIGGTAVNGTDYTTLSGSIVIPAGQTSAQIVVAPIQHALGGNKTVVVTLSASANYTINSSYNADTVTIYDYGNTVTKNAVSKKKAGLVVLNQASKPRLGNFFASHFFINSARHTFINPNAILPLMLGQVTPPPLPQLGTTTFFTDVQNRLTTTGSTMFYGKEILPAQNSPYDTDSGTAQVNCFVFSADKYHLDTYATTAVGHTIANAVSDNPNASLILNGAQFGYHCLHKYLGMQLQSWSIFGGMANDNPEPFQTIGVVIHGGSVLSPTSSSPSKGSSSSWTTAQGRYWMGQSTAANNGQALSYLFGQGIPTASATPEALGGLGALICPDHTPTVVGKTPGMSGYWPIKHEKRPGYNIIGVNRATGMIIVISKDSGQPGGVWRVQPLLIASGVDFAVVTDGGGTVGCWSKTQGYLARGWRQLTTPSDIDTPTTYLIFTPNN